MNSQWMKNNQLEGDSFFWPAGNTGVLLIHGFTATTAEVRLLASFLFKKGYTVSGPLLPGHGTTPDELNKTHWQDWTQCIENAYQDLKQKTDEVVVVGESVGGLLSLFLASEHPEINSILLYATALSIKNIRLSFLLSRIKKFQKKSGVDDRKLPWKGYTVNPLRAVTQIYRLQKVIHQRLTRITQPALIAHGLLDHTIDPKTSEFIYNSISSELKKLIWYKNSTHCVLIDFELEKVSADALEFIQETTG